MSTGGPAFPCDYEGSTRSDASGMTLVDYFAAKAMQAMVSTPTYEGGGWHQDDIAEQAYRMAKAMLRARQRS